MDASGACHAGLDDAAVFTTGLVVGAPPRANPPPISSHKRLEAKIIAEQKLRAGHADWLEEGPRPQLAHPPKRRPAQEPRAAPKRTEGAAPRRAIVQQPRSRMGPA